MSYDEFIGLIVESPVAYFVTLIITLAVYLSFFRKQINSVFDPLFMTTVTMAFAATDVVFLWRLDLIDAQCFIQFISTETAFFVGLMLFRPLKCHEHPMRSAGGGIRRFFVLLHGGEKRFLHVLYVVSVITFMIVQAITYAIRGIPILYASRLEYYSVGGGIGILSHVLAITWFFSCYLLIYCLASTAKTGSWSRLFNFIVGVALVASPLLSGSKATFVSIVFVIFYFRFLHREDQACSVANKFLAKLQWATIVFAIAAAVFVISVQQATSDPAVWIAVLSVRFASYGDVYFMAYPTHLVDSISSKDGFLAVFGGLLGTFRLVPYNAMPESLGILLHRMIYGFDNITGPNARHNVFGLVYFGQVGSIFYSLTIGMIVGFIRNRLPAFVRPGSAIEPLFVFLAISCLAVISDLQIAMMDVISIILVAPVLYAITALVYFASTRQGARHSPRVVVARTTRPDAGRACPC
jgi:hypothetical protein